MGKALSEVGEDSGLTVLSLATLQGQLFSTYITLTTPLDKHLYIICRWRGNVFLVDRPFS